jgi:3-dehydrotetronate 4-kinase
MLLGCIADDLTGATDLALMLTRAGMRTVQVMSVPDASTKLDGYDAVVVALKSRTNPAADAVAMSLASADALLVRGAKQLFFKYCSTFDSTDRGNIGPVADALMARLKTDLAIVCPAFPTNKRTIYLGNLFVGDVPLDESPMQDHPLTPMRDANLVRVMQRQTKHKVGLVPFSTVNKGADAIDDAFRAARARGERYVVCDAITDEHLYDLGKVAADMALITGGSGIALGLPSVYIKRGLMTAVPPPQTMAASAGRSAILAGSCSEATRGQVKAAVVSGIPAYRIEPMKLADGSETADSLARWALAQPAAKPVLIYSSDEPAHVRAVQEKLGRDAAGTIIEQALAETAQRLIAASFTRLIVAGGETSGAVVNGLQIDALEIGPEIDPGVPWTKARGRGANDADLVLALKSGNFGAADFFTKAWGKLS